MECVPLQLVVLALGTGALGEPAGDRAVGQGSCNKKRKGSEHPRRESGGVASAVLM